MKLKLTAQRIKWFVSWLGQIEAYIIILIRFLCSFVIFGACGFKCDQGKTVLSIKYIYNIILYCFGWIFSLSSDCINIVVPKFRRHRKYRKRKRLNTFYATAKLWMCECKHDSYISLYSQIFILVFRLVHYHIRSSFRFDFRDLIHPTIFYVRLSKAQINYISTSIYWNYTLRIKWISISNAFIQIFVIWLFYFLAERFCNHCSQLDRAATTTTTTTIDRFQVNKQKYDAFFFRPHTTRSAWMYVNRELAACTNVLHSDFWISVRYSKAMFTRCVVTISYICIVCAHFRGKCPFECLHICIYSASDV